MIRRTIEIRQAEGLTPRVAARIVRYAQECACQIECVAENGRISMKSLMAVLSLGLGHGASITIETNGEDEAAAMNTLAALLAEEGEES